jgi:hypothetical protein
MTRRIGQAVRTLGHFVHDLDRRERSGRSAPTAILLTGRHLTGAEAQQVGLIGRAVPDGQPPEIAESIAADGPVAARAILRTMREPEGERVASPPAPLRALAMLADGGDGVDDLVGGMPSGSRSARARSRRRDSPWRRFGMRPTPPDVLCRSRRG